jgi:hypothetical protein
MGLTVTCARCHDHKYDPIPTRDYYSLYGIFASSQEPKDLPLLGDPERTDAYLAFEAELNKLQAEVTRYEEEHREELQARNRAARNELRKRQQQVDRLKVTHPGAPPCAMVLVDAPEPVEPRVFIRGNSRNPGETVPRQFLQILAGEQRQPFQKGSGRLELAQAIVSRDNPLTARVLVNRIWLHHFGVGLVRTPSDFGVRSEPPSYPELLDYLASRFMDNGWSVKELHRLILLSSVYQQSSDDIPANRRLDPDNRLLWRMNRQRLDFEAMRDSLLSVAGHLDTTVGGKAVELTKQPFSRRRTLYGFIDRQNLPGMFRTFDFASPDTHSPQRYTTTVPQQALFLMNSPFVVEQARRLAQQVQPIPETDVDGRIQQLYRIVYGRAAGATEVSVGRQFVAATPPETGEEAAPLTAWEKYAQVLLLANEFAFVD